MPGSFLIRMSYDAEPGSKADILHGEGSKYGAGVPYHFHPRLRPGDSTLNLHIVRQLLRTMSANGGGLEMRSSWRTTRALCSIRRRITTRGRTTA